LGLLLFGFAGFGCGTDFNNVLFQSLASAGRSAFDLTLTDLANSVANVADSLNAPASDADQGGGEGDASGGSDNDSDGDGDSGEATDGGVPPDGDATNGRAVFDANGCSTCHCDDASGGCALNAPSLQGVEAQEVTDKLTGVVGHTGGTRELTDSELADLAAYLADLAGGGASNVDPDVGSGLVLYESNGCGSCHCADGSGGCAADAPAITGATTTVLDEFLRGATTHTGGKKDLSDGGIESLAAFLAGG